MSSTKINLTHQFDVLRAQKEFEPISFDRVGSGYTLVLQYGKETQYRIVAAKYIDKVVNGTFVVMYEDSVMYSGKIRDCKEFCTKLLGNN